MSRIETVERGRAIEDMRPFVEAGITLFDCADPTNALIERKGARTALLTLPDRRDARRRGVRKN